MSFPRKHFLALVCALLLWGFSFPALKIALKTNTPLAVTFYRYGIAFVLTLPVLAKRRREWRNLLRHPGLWLLGLFNFGGSLLQFAGLRLTTAIKSVVLTQTMVVIVPVFAFWLLRERLDRTKTAAIVLSIAGAVMLSTNLDFRGFSTAGTVAGDLLTVGAVVFWSLFIVVSRLYATKTAAAWMLLANYAGTFVLASGAGAVQGGLGLDAAGAWLCLFLAVFCTLIPTALYFFSLREVDATSSAIAGPLEAVSAGAIAFFFMGERLTLIGAGGTVLIVAAAYLVANGGRLGARGKRGQG